MSGERHSALRVSLRLALTLFIITAVAALCMSLVNQLTQGRIARLFEERRRAAMAAVVPLADVFSQVPYDSALAEDMYAAWQGSTPAGYCVRVSADGFAGPISLMVGVDTQNKVTGVALLEHRETAGVGTRADDGAFLNQFKGRTGLIRIKKDGGEIDAVSGATVTSRAVADGVSRALDAVKTYVEKGGAGNEEGEV